MATLVQRTLGVILAGGAGERLYPLTRHRAKPAVPFGGHYRIIDITLSNFVNSGLRKLFVLTQYKSLSLHRHIRNGWSNVVATDLEEFIEILPPQKRVGENWYMATGDAVYQNLYSIRSVDGIDFVLVLSGDHIYKMNYYWLLRAHVSKRADVTVSSFEVPLEEARQFGVINVDGEGRIRGFAEKPERPQPSSSDPTKACISMGIYIFKKSLLMEILEADAENPDSNHDFGTHIIPTLLDRCEVYAHNFQDENKKEARYWMDVGTIDSYYEANMDLTSVSPQFNLYDDDWPIRTYQPQYPPAKFVFADEGKRTGTALDSIVSAGCIVSGGRIVNCVISPDVRINSYSEISQSILFPCVSVGRYSRIRKAIIDRGVSLPAHTVIGFDPDEDRRRFQVTANGVVVVSQEDADLETRPRLNAARRADK